MPSKALVALGVVLGLLNLSVPAWSSEMSAPAGTGHVAGSTAPGNHEKRVEGPAADLPVLTIDEAATRALRHNPRLAAFAREVEARESETLQAGLRPNPELSVEMENFAGSGEFSGTDNAEATVRLSQRVELGGKRERRRQLARLDRDVTEKQYELARSEVLAEADERFVAVLAAREKVDLAAEQLALTRKVLQTVEDRVTSGKTARIEKVRFRTLVTEARLRHEKARQGLAAARKSLATLWGSEEADFSATHGAFQQVRKIPGWSELVSRLAESPAVVVQKSAVHRADRAVDLERANRIPDLTVSLGVKEERRSGDNALLAEVGIPLPLFDRNQGAVAAARSRRAKAQSEAEAARMQLQDELAETWRRLSDAYSEVKTLHEEILPANRESFDAIVYGYQAGKFEFLDVLDAERSLFEAKSRYIEALSDYHQAVSEAERLLGGELFTNEGELPPTDMQRGQS